ncbi:hypothetical protein PINS_up017524 [Pythium insidiosum]|nr:hypothetical protein PINS_up017524 [Pythium insidiosum]
MRPLAVVALVAVLAPRLAAAQSSASTGTLPHVAGQPLLGGQYTEDGQPLTRQDVQESSDELQAQWKCEVCDFHNKASARACVLCGTERGFSFGVLLHTPSHQRSMSITSSNNNPGRERGRRAAGARSRSTARARSRGVASTCSTRGSAARATARSGCARSDSTASATGPRRELPLPFPVKDKTDKTDKEASRTSATASLSSSPTASPDTVVVDIDSSSSQQQQQQQAPAVAPPTSPRELVHQQSLAFVSQAGADPAAPRGPHDVQGVSRGGRARGVARYEISEQDLEILEQVAALPFKDKYAWFLEQTSALIKPWEDGQPQDARATARTSWSSPWSSSWVSRWSTSTCHCASSLSAKSPIDAGGLEREWFALVTEKLFDETIGLFMCAHVDSLAYVINPNSVEASADHLLYFRGAGRLLGRALLEGQLMKAHLALPLLKHLLGVPISFADLEFIDAEVYRSLKWMKENDGVDALCLDFSVTNRKLSGDVEEAHPGV